MHPLLHLLLQTSTSPPTTAGKSSKSSSSSYAFIIIIVLFVVVYVAFIRPRSQKMRQQQTAGRQLAVGDQVMSAGGIYGTVVALDTDVVEVEVASGVVMTFTRRAISPRPGGPTTVAGPEPVDDQWELPAAGGPDPESDEDEHLTGGAGDGRDAEAGETGQPGAGPAS